MTQVMVTRKHMVTTLEDLESQAPWYIEESERVDYQAMSDEQLSETYCLTGLFAQWHSGHEETDLVII